MGEIIDDLMARAMCAMCGMGVHFEAGRVACDGCDLPTDCCLCEPLPILRADPEPPPEVRALESWESPGRRRALPAGPAADASPKRRAPRTNPSNASKTSKTANASKAPKAPKAANASKSKAPQPKASRASAASRASKASPDPSAKRRRRPSS